MKNRIKLPIILALGLLSGCGSARMETVETRYVFLNPEADQEQAVHYEGKNIILPVSLVTAVGETITYGSAKHPRKVSVGGNYPVKGTGYDYNEDGIFDRLEKRSPHDTLSMADLERALNMVKERAKRNPHAIYTDGVKVSER